MEKTKQSPLASALLVGIGIIIVVGVLFCGIGFWLGWAGMTITDLPPLFWVLYVTPFGGLMGFAIVAEIKAWRDKTPDTRTKFMKVFYAAFGVAFLLDALFRGPWNGSRLMHIGLGVIYLLWGASAILRSLLLR